MNRQRQLQALEFLRRQDPVQPVLIVADSRRASEELTRPLARPALGWHRLGWEDLQKRLAPHREALTPLASWALLQKALQEAPGYEELRGFPGFAVCLQRTVRELRLHQVVGPPPLAGVQAEFAALLEQHALQDEAARLEEACRGQSEWLSQFRALLVVEVPIRCQLERGLLARLQQVIPENLVLPLEEESPPGDVQLLSGADETLECQELTRELLRGAARGWAWDEMAILLREPQRYGWCLLATLERAGVPAYPTGGAVLPHPMGRALLALLQCARENLSARRFAEYLSLAEAPLEVFRGEALEEEEGVRREVPAPYRWEELLGAASVIRGPGRWRSRLRALGQERATQLAELRRQDPDSPRIQACAQEIELLGGLEEFALPLIERLAAWPGRQSWALWLQELDELARLALAHPQPVLLKLHELRPLAALGQASLEEVVAVLAPELAQLRVPPQGHRYGKVLVGTLEEARGRSFELVLLPGMAERRYPPLPREDPLLEDRLRGELHPELSTRASQAGDERQLVRTAVGAAHSRLVVSFPRQDQEHGRPLLPAVTLMNLLREGRGRLPTAHELMREATENSTLRAAWPAPERPEEANDWEEHSLSWLRRLRAEGRQGCLHFLLADDPVLSQALRHKLRRQRPEWSIADGCLGLPAETLQPLWPSRRPYSASALEKFAACPYSFWLSVAYRLGPRETPQPLEEMDPLTRGSFVHEVHARLVWRAKGLEHALEDWLGWLPEVAAAVARDYADRLDPLVPRVFWDEARQLEKELAEWLTIRHAEGAWTPIHAELSFAMAGQGARDPASSPHPADLGRGYRLRGSIDRVERNARGQLRLADLKTGWPKARWNFHIGGGEVLQPVLYALAVRNALGAPVLASSLEYCTAKGGMRSVGLEAVDEAAETAYAALEHMEESLRRGHLPAHPRPQGCQYCDYRPICGGQAEALSRSKGSGAATEAVEFWRNQK